MQDTDSMTTDRDLGYRRRIVDNQLDRLLSGLAAVSIEGPRAVGKTATATQRAKTIHFLDDRGAYALLAADPTRILEEATPVLIDEWQLMPEIWDVVRRAVDAGGPPGRFILTGSQEVGDARIHSGAGRISTLRMGSMTLPERGASQPTVSLSEFLDGGRPALAGHTTTALREYVDEILATGMPGLRGLPDDLLTAQLGSYVARIVDRDAPSLGVGGRKRASLLAWMRAYASAVSGTTSKETIRDAATPGQGHKPARTTTDAYLDALESLWVVEPVPAWHPTKLPISEFTVSPKHQMFDPGITAYLIGESADSILAGAVAGPLLPRAATIMGALFESQVVHDVAVYARAVGAEIHHFREHRGKREVDVVVRRRDGRVLAIEVKLTRVPDAHDLKHLQWLRTTIGDQLIDSMVITTGADAYRRPDGIAVVPLALLGP
jgi:predicted AAA+ superfamily ATPase